ncbi:MAG: tryptophan 7-halogenase [Burkholderiales bacterium]|nr:tryptophan 7-halogenase [Phycisphaerae bacterium]
MMKSILILGAGSAGLIAALTLKRKVPNVSVRVVRSPEIGVIGVGESTTVNVGEHFFEYLKIPRRRFYELAEPTWKIGIHFLWGPLPQFDYAFEPQMGFRAPGLSRPNGFYCEDRFDSMNLQSELMAHGKAFARQPNGAPDIPPWAAFHLENVKLVKALETFAREDGVEFIDAKVQGAERGPEGIAAVILEDGRRLEADFFVDASGFRSELLGKTLEEPFVSFAGSLFNDRAVVGRWDRTDEPTLPYTTAETMDSGWCWRIDHERTINRGYVYSSGAISDDDAREEFVRKNPKANVFDRVIKFRSGRYGRAWVDNVLGVGNSCGFVEPLESSGLMMVCLQCNSFAEMIVNADPTPSLRGYYNKLWAASWDEIRDFLTLHFWLNTRLDTPYWQHCRHDADVSRLTALLEFYQENGPVDFSPYQYGNTANAYGIDGFLVMLVANRFPHRAKYVPTSAERQSIANRRIQYKALAQSALTVEEALAYVRHPNWRWFAES